MEKRDYRLKGHESFILRDGWLTKGLNAVREDAKVFSKNSGADALGVGTNMAKSIRYWLRASGLTEENIRTGVTLSELGNLVADNDLYFEDMFSLWLVHANIVRNFSLATSWNLFFNDLEISTFTRDELYREMTELIVTHTGDTTPSERSIKDDCAAILAMYGNVNDAGNDPEDKKISPFGPLHLIEANGLSFEKSKPAVNSITPFLIYYMVADRLVTEKSLSIDEITGGRNMPGKVLNLNRVIINDYLDALQNKGLITVNRTAGLDMVYPNTEDTSIDAVRNYYERSRTI